METRLENPADQLSTIVIRLFQLAGDTRIQPKTRRDKIFLAAHKLHGFSMTFAQIQFQENTAKYKDAMDRITKVNGDLRQAKEDIQKIVKTVDDVGKLLASVEKLLVAVAGAIA